MTKEEKHLSLSKGWVKGRLRPRFRHLIIQDTRQRIKKKSIKVEPPIKDDNIVEDLSFLDNLDSNEVNGDTEIIVIEDDSATVIDVSEMSSRLVEFEMKEDTTNIKEEPSVSIPINSRLAVRKFPSYGWSREKEARVKVQISEEKDNVSASKSTKPSSSAAAAVAVMINKSLDFPVFQLSGLAETAPKEVEGWFTSKVSLLRKLSEETPGSSNVQCSTKSSSPSSSRSGSIQKKTKRGSKVVPTVKVFLDQDVEAITDLAEYKQGLEQIKEIIEEIETATNAANASGDNNDQDLIITETLRVARKIEKISISGIGKQVSLPSPNSFLPPGWHCRKTGLDHWEYLNNDGVKVKSIQAAIKYETTLRLNNSSSNELL